MDKYGRPKIQLVTYKRGFREWLISRKLRKDPDTRVNIRSFR